MFPAELGHKPEASLGLRSTIIPFILDALDYCAIIFATFGWHCVLQRE